MRRRRATAHHDPTTASGFHLIIDTTARANDNDDGTRATLSSSTNQVNIVGLIIGATGAA